MEALRCRQSRTNAGLLPIAVGTSASEEVEVAPIEGASRACSRFVLSYNGQVIGVFFKSCCQEQQAAQPQPRRTLLNNLSGGLTTAIPTRNPETPSRREVKDPIISLYGLIMDSYLAGDDMSRQVNN